MKVYDVIILGGGAAGLMCAIEAGKRGRKVIILEGSNRVGKKILMSGGGRCNFTNLAVTADHYISSNQHFCKSALARYTQWDFIALVERYGIAYHEKELGQLFCDTSSKQIVAMLLAECTTVDVRIEVNSRISDVIKTCDGYQVITESRVFLGKTLVIATGGLSIPKMGASGLGYTLAQQFGHAIVPTCAALVPLTFGPVELDHYAELSGISLSAATECTTHRFESGLLFTHRGISGPAVLQISSYWRSGTPLEIDLLPNIDAEIWIQERSQARPEAALHSVLAEVMPKRLAGCLSRITLGDKPMKQYLPSELSHIASLLKAWTFKPSGTEGYRTAEVTLGGVNVNEISSATMESTLQSGLYIIGEVMDVTGHLGGFNFQWAWASGHAAGQVV